MGHGNFISQVSKVAREEVEPGTENGEEQAESKAESVIILWTWINGDASTGTQN